MNSFDFFGYAMAFLMAACGLYVLAGAIAVIKSSSRGRGK